MRFQTSWSSRFPRVSRSASLATFTGNTQTSCTSSTCTAFPYLFNGDFVDRGNQGVEVTLTVFAFQQLYPGAIFLNRGNHEEASCHSVDGFRKECIYKYGLAVYDLYERLFTRLPLATVLNGAVLVVHGGVDSNFTLEQLRDADRAAYVAIVNSGSAKRKRFARPEGAKRGTHIEQTAQIEALAKANYPINAALWNDPGICEGECFNKVSRHRNGLRPRRLQTLVGGQRSPAGHTIT